MPSRREFAFIIHGARAERPELRHLVDWVRGRGDVVRPRITWEPGDAAAMAAEAARAGTAAVVAVGGDGTVNEVVNGLAGSDVPLGIIPLGTANDFARQLGIPIDDPDHAMDVILRRKPVRIDTGSLDGRRFVNVSTGGVGARVTAETSAEAKDALGALAYAVSGARHLAELAPRRLVFTGPEIGRLETDVVAFAVGNGQETGGGTRFTPRALLRDGRLDLCVITARPLPELARLVLRLRRGEHLGDDDVVYERITEVTVRAADGEPIAANVDGERAGGVELHYRVCPGDLRVHAVRLPGEEVAAIEAGHG